MLQKLKFTAKDWQKVLFYIISFTILCIATLFFMLCIGAFIITNVDTPDYILIPLSTILITLSSFLDSFIIAKLFKENGLIIGLSIGLIFAILIVVIALVHSSLAFTSLLISKIRSVVAAGLIGGIIGVNL